MTLRSNLAGPESTGRHLQDESWNTADYVTVAFLCDSTEDLDSSFRVVDASQGALLPYLHIHSSALL